MSGIEFRCLIAWLAAIPPGVACAYYKATPSEADSIVALVERTAAGKLKVAKLLARDGLVDKARLRCQAILTQFPTTKAAAEAQSAIDLLDRTLKARQSGGWPSLPM